MNKIGLKSPAEIEIMAEGGQKLSLILAEVLNKIKPGLSTLQIDSWIDEGIEKAGGKPSFKMVKDYRYASCVGLNAEVVHSIPKIDKKVRVGDLLKIDLGMLYKGFHTDLSWTIEVGTKKESNFLKTGEEALRQAVEIAKKGNRVGHISQKIQEIIQNGGYQPVRVLTGHGIGRSLHEEPMIPGVFKGKLERTPLLEKGMTLAVEVIYAQKSPDVVLESDGWTISTKDGKISALFEETIAITENGPLILTPTDFCKGSF